MDLMTLERLDMQFSRMFQEGIFAF